MNGSQLNVVGWRRGLLMEGQDIAMTQTIDARRVGGCTARQ
jgi:hypothetical protein